MVLGGTRALDGQMFSGMEGWLADDKDGWVSIATDGLRERGERFSEHLGLFRQAMDRTINPPLGRPPKDLLEVIIGLMAVAAPGVVLYARFEDNLLRLLGIRRIFFTVQFGFQKASEPCLTFRKVLRFSEEMNKRLSTGDLRFTIVWKEISSRCWTSRDIA